MTLHCSDVVVIGAGPAGAVCARELVRRGHCVTLVDRTRTPRWRHIETCAPDLSRTLARTGVRGLPSHVLESLDCFESRWGSAESDIRDFQFWSASPGVILSRGLFDEWLQDLARDAGVTVFEGSRVAAAEQTVDGWRLRTSVQGETQTLTAKFVVEATGRLTRSVCWPDVSRVFLDRLVCLCVDVTSAGHDNSTSAALVESDEDGWWFTACKASEGRRYVAYFTDADFVRRSGTYSAHFMEKLATSERMKDFVGPDAVPAVRATDARTSVRTMLWRSSWLAIGDAAWTLDPLSGNGVVRALLGGVRAAQALSTALNTERTDALRSSAMEDAAAFQHALVRRRAYYAAEQRWRDSEFWARRMALRA